MTYRALNAGEHSKSKTGCSTEIPFPLCKIKGATTMTNRLTSTLPTNCPLFKIYGFTVVSELHRNVLKRIPSLEEGVNYIARKLVGPERWDITDKGEHADFGCIISFLVKGGHLPLRRVANTGRNWAQYQLI